MCVCARVVGAKLNVLHGDIKYSPAFLSPFLSAAFNACLCAVVLSSAVHSAVQLHTQYAVLVWSYCNSDVIQWRHCKLRRTVRLTLKPFVQEFTDSQLQTVSENLLIVQCCSICVGSVDVGLILSESQLIVLDSLTQCVVHARSIILIVVRWKHCSVTDHVTLNVSFQIILNFPLQDLHL